MHQSPLPMTGIYLKAGFTSAFLKIIIQLCMESEVTLEFFFFFRCNPLHLTVGPSIQVCNASEFLWQSPVK